MSKSFKDIYNEDKVSVLRQPKEEPAPEIKEEPVVVAAPQPLDESVQKEILEKVQEQIAPQIQESEKIVETLVRSNKKISSTVAKLVESANETNTKLLEAITALTEKVAMLEGKLEQMRDIEIPTPVVNLQMPGKKTIKTVHRDKKGFITHIEESESFDAEDSDDSA